MEKICVSTNCNKPFLARGFCKSCYEKHRRHNNFIPNSITTLYKHRLSKINPLLRKGICAVCGEIKIYPRRDRRENHASGWRCSEQTKAHAIKWHWRKRELKKKMLSKNCQICFSIFDLCFDHNHQTNKFRGTLCQTCNKGLGFFKENPNLILKAHEYLLKSS